MTRAIDAVCHALETRPEDFSEDDDDVLLDKKTGMQYWIYGGFLSYGVYRPVELSFGFFERLRFGMALRRWRDRVVVEINRRAAS